MSEVITKRVATALTVLGTTQIFSGVGAALTLLLFTSRGTFRIVGEEILMEGWAIKAAVCFVAGSVAAAGAVSVFRLRWGWVLSFSVAAFVLTMALLMGPGTIAVTMWSFLGLMVLSLVNWAAAILYYYYDLYT